MNLIKSKGKKMNTSATERSGINFEPKVEEQPSAIYHS